MALSKALKLAIAAAAGLLAALALWWFLARGASQAELVSSLPDRPAATLFVDVTVLRAAGLMKRLAAPEAAQEQDYRDFVAATGFDYTRHLDRFAARFSSTGDLWIAASGRFDPAKLAAYAAARGGRCVRGICTMQGSGPSRQISWLESDGRMLQLAVSSDPLAAATMGPSNKPSWKLPSSPVWLHLPGSQLKPAEGLPPGTSALLSSLQGANEALFRTGIGARGLTIELEAPFSTEAAARDSAGRLTEATAMFNKLLNRQQPAADSSAFAAALSSGVFKAVNTRVNGTWTLESSRLEQLLQ